MSEEVRLRRPEGGMRKEKQRRGGQGRMGPVQELWGLQEATGGVRPQAQFPGLSGEQVLGAREKAEAWGHLEEAHSRGRLGECASLLMPGMREEGKGSHGWLPVCSTAGWCSCLPGKKAGGGKSRS